MSEWIFFLVFWLMYIYSVLHNQTIKWRPTEFHMYIKVCVCGCSPPLYREYMVCVRLDNTSRAFFYYPLRVRYYIVHRDLQKNSHARSHSPIPPTCRKTTAKSYIRDSCDIFIWKASSYHSINLCMPFIKYYYVRVKWRGRVEIACHLYVILWHLNLRIASALFYSFIHFHTRSQLCVM